MNLHVWLVSDLCPIVLFSAISSPSNAPSLVVGAPSPATFLRAFYTYLTLPVAQGGLDITPKSTAYPHLEQIFAPHVASFKSDWLASLQAPRAGGALGGIGYDDTDIARIGSLVSILFLISYLQSSRILMLEHYTRLRPRSPSGMSYLYI